MKTYIYVLAIVAEKDLKREGPGAIRFESVQVTATDESAAYAIGGSMLDFEAGDGETANDYVIELPVAVEA